MVKKEVKKKRKADLKLSKDKYLEDNENDASDDGTSGMSNEEFLLEKWQDTYVSVMEHLVDTTHKKSSMEQRIKSLKELKWLCQRVHNDSVIDMIGKSAESLASQCLSGIKQDDPDLVLVSNEALSSLIVLCPDQIAHMKEKILQRLYNKIDHFGIDDEEHPSRPEEEDLSDDDDEELTEKVRKSCLKTVGLFLFSTEENDLLLGYAEDMKIYFEDSVLCATAVGVFTLLLSCATHEERSEVFQDMWIDILNMLSGPEQDFTMYNELGKLICLFMESFRELEEEWLSNYDMEELRLHFQSISGYFSKSYSKKEVSEHKRNFRDYSSYVLDEEEPQREITIRGHPVAIESWQNIIRFEAIKDCIQSGISYHIVSNEFVRNALELSGNYQIWLKKDVTKVEKRYLYSKSSSDAKKDTLEKNSRTRFVH